MPLRSQAMLRRPLLLLITCCALVVSAAPAASAASSYDIYDDCQDNGRLDGDYTGAELRKALGEMAEDFKEYDSCDEQIQAAQAGLTKKSTTQPSTGGSTTGGGGTTTQGGGTGGGGTNKDLPQGNGVGSVPLGPDNKPLNPEIDAREDERAAINEARAQIKPTTAGVRPGEPDSEIPPALIVVLVLAGIAGLAAGGLMARQVLTGRDATA